MIVTIWRHGEAGKAITDQLRELTGQGEDDVGFGCHQFHESCEARGLLHPDLILHSPWLRTSQTADIIATAFSHARMRPLAAIQPGGDLPAVDAALEEAFSADQPPRHIVLVSHQPLVTHLLDYYLGDPGRVPPLTPGGLATLQLEMPARGCGKLLFWALPEEYEAGL